MKNTIKKILLAMAVVPLMVSSAFAAAALYETAIANGDSVATADCPLLASAVTIGMSKDINGAISCDESAGSIQVGTCSKGGSTATKTIACTLITAADANGPGDPAADVYNDTTCDGTPSQTFESVGRSWFTMSTDGGGLSEAALNTSGDTACDSAVVLTKIQAM